MSRLSLNLQHPCRTFHGFDRNVHMTDLPRSKRISQTFCTKRVLRTNVMNIPFLLFECLVNDDSRNLRESFAKHLPTPCHDSDDRFSFKAANKTASTEDFFNKTNLWREFRINVVWRQAKSPDKQNTGVLTYYRNVSRNCQTHRSQQHCPKTTLLLREAPQLPRHINNTKPIQIALRRFKVDSTILSATLSTP